MKKLIVLYKPVGLTPLQAVEIFKNQNLEYKNKKISYPGRLDPMAEGILILLVGNENKKIVQYMKLDKEYSAQILFGFSTDSYDILGLPEKSNKDYPEIRELKKQIKNLKGNYIQKLPAFSSYKIKGKSLFYYARNNLLDNIEIPERSVKIKQIKINSIYTITGNRLLKQINKKIDLLQGDFRQKQIKKKWEEVIGKDKEGKYLVTDLTISCGSGTYIRAIANDLGKKFNSALLINLIRTRVGKFSLKEAVRINKLW